METCTWVLSDGAETFNSRFLPDLPPSPLCQNFAGENIEQLLECDDPALVQVTPAGGPILLDSPLFEYTVPRKDLDLKLGEMFSEQSSEFLPGVGEINFVDKNSRCSPLNSFDQGSDLDCSSLPVLSPESKENVFSGFPNTWPPRSDRIWDDSFANANSSNAFHTNSSNRTQTKRSRRPSDSDSGICDTELVKFLNDPNRSLKSVDRMKATGDCKIASKIPGSVKGASSVKIVQPLTSHKDRVKRNTVVKLESKDDSDAMKILYPRALDDHKYTLKVRPDSFVANSSKANSVPSLLEQLLRCQTKLNPNLGSDHLLSNKNTSRSVSDCRTTNNRVKDEHTKRKADKQKAVPTPAGQADRHRSDHSSKMPSLYSVAKTDFDAYDDADMHSMDAFDDESNADVLDSVFDGRLGIDHILADGFGLESGFLIGDDMLDLGLDGFGSSFLDSDSKMEQNDWVKYVY